MKHQKAQKRLKYRSRKHLNADALFNRLHIDFSPVETSDKPSAVSFASNTGRALPILEKILAGPKGPTN